MDGNTAQKTYPRTTDPAYNKRLAITAVTTNSFTVNVGKSSASDQYAHTFVSALTDAIAVDRIQGGKSPYIQGVTTIGNNCVGMKIDGALHDGGNRSIVANDFAGIARWYWLLGNEPGPLKSCLRIMHTLDIWQKMVVYFQQKETNRGDFGTVAEGLIPTETPNLTVNNRDNEALVDRILQQVPMYLQQNIKTKTLYNSNGSCNTSKRYCT